MMAMNIAGRARDTKIKGLKSEINVEREKMEEKD